MALTPTQLAALKAAITADTTLAAWAATGYMAENIANALNETAEPAYIVWRTSVEVDEIMRNGMDWTRVDNMSVGKARIWDWLGRLGHFDASRVNIRAGIDACWVGTAADLAVRAMIYAHSKRSATRGEKIMATGTDTDASPATMSFEGMLTYQHVEAALQYVA